MKLLALVTDAFGGSGGIARYNCDLLTALAECGGDWRIVVLPRQGKAAPGDLPPGVDQLAPRPGKLSYAAAALALVARDRRIDAVFCGHLNLAPLAAGAAWLCRAPLWLQLHGQEAWRPPSRAQAAAAARASLITTVSRYTRQQFLRFAAVQPFRLRVLPNTVDPGFAPGPKPRYLIDRYGVGGRKVLLTVGRLNATERRKGHDRVIEAIGKMSSGRTDLVYLIVGEGDDRARLQDLANRVGIRSRVLFAGRVEPAELPDHYRLADVFVMPSSQEGFGIVFLEAAASGLRPIGGNADGSLDPLADGVIGDGVDPLDLDELTRAIERALSGSGFDPDGAERYRFDNFVGQVCALTEAYLATAGCTKDAISLMKRFGRAL